MLKGVDQISEARSSARASLLTLPRVRDERMPGYDDNAGRRNTV
jgi:hypothetical protein